MFPMDKLSRIQLEDASNFLSRELPFIHSVELVIQLGTGQKPDNLLDEIWNRIELRYMPHIPQEESLVDHNLEIIWGVIGRHKVLVLAGRFHIYEGYGRVPCILPIWAAANCGARNFLFANASGGVNPSFEPGTLMLLNDHINNLGYSALAGHQHLLKTPFIDMTELYHSKMRASFEACADEMGIKLKSGVYCANTGPNFETNTEVKFLAQAGVDAVGMSTVLEATLAHALGAQVLAISMIINRASSPEHKKQVDGKKETGRTAKRQLNELIRNWLAKEEINLL